MGSVSQLIEDASATSVVSEVSASSLWWLLLCLKSDVKLNYDNSLWLLIFHQVKIIIQFALIWIWIPSESLIHYFCLIQTSSRSHAHKLTSMHFAEKKLLPFGEWQQGVRMLRFALRTGSMCVQIEHAETNSRAANGSNHICRSLIVRNAVNESQTGNVVEKPSNWIVNRSTFRIHFDFQRVWRIKHSSYSLPKLIAHHVWTR